MLEQLTTFLYSLRNRHFLGVDIVVLALTPALALVLRTEQFAAIAQYGHSLVLVTVAFLLVKLALFYPAGLYRQFWRYASIDELAKIVGAGTVALAVQTLLFFGILRPMGIVGSGFPRSVPLLDGLLTLLAVGGTRFSVRFVDRLRQHIQGRRQRGSMRTWPVLVMGAGDAGAMIVRELKRNPQVGLDVVGFIDDDPDKRNQRIHGIPVLGDRQDIPTLVRRHDIRRVIIAMPTAPGKVIRDVVDICDRAQVHTKIMPGIYELLDGTVSVNQLRDVEIEDLLRREPIRTNVADVETLLRGKRVLVTGGGGSIGSELCRQILRCEPSELIILGHGENSVFTINQELRSKLGPEPATTICPAIADTRFAGRLEAIFRQHRPQVVFHAAAHKHVPLMEHNPPEAITNNVVGTRNLLEVAVDTGVERFVMISTDKAVNPTSTMGASKRAAELLVHRTAEATGRPYVTVRFGNVLGSNGSVVNTFKQQIADGGPVTVTHPDMRRYFMTIPEAVQLVLQASALGAGGEVFVLDMGEPVKIVDLASDLIQLSGLEVGRDIDIVFTGIRPGEKLFEELFVDGESYERTRHQKIFLADNASSIIPDHLDGSIEALEAAAWRNDAEAVRRCLQALIPTFQPQTDTAPARPQRDRATPAVTHRGTLSPQTR